VIWDIDNYHMFIFIWFESITSSFLPLKRKIFDELHHLIQKFLQTLLFLIRFFKHFIELIGFFLHFIEILLVRRIIAYKTPA